MLYVCVIFVTVIYDIGPIKQTLIVISIYLLFNLKLVMPYDERF